MPDEPKAAPARQPRRKRPVSGRELAQTPAHPARRENLGFAMPVMDLLTDRMLLPVDRLVAAILAGYAGQDYVCWPTNATLAQDVGCDRKTVYLALRRLQALGWITLEPAPGKVVRGQLIRLNWTRKPPEDDRKPVPGGSATRARGGKARDADRIRPEDSPLDAPSRQGEQKSPILSETDLASMRDLARAANPWMRRMAAAAIRDHESAVAGREAGREAGRVSPPGEPLAGVPGGDLRETLADKAHSTEEPSTLSMGESPMQHKRH